MDFPALLWLNCNWRPAADASETTIQPKRHGVREGSWLVSASDWLGDWSRPRVSARNKVTQTDQRVPLFLCSLWRKSTTLNFRFLFQFPVTFCSYAGKKNRRASHPKMMNKKKVHETRGHEGQMREKIISDTFIIMYHPSLAFWKVPPEFLE